ncbi:hypothetical protein GCM10020256_36810 [Streptomyces thermocoprophilus]
MTITLSRVAARVPSGRDSVDEILARHDRPRAERRLFTRIFGLRTSPSLADGETLLELLLDAAEEALDGRRAALVLYGHTLLVQPFGHHDEFAGHLRERLGLPGVPVYGISRINCASVLRGTDLAERFLRRPAPPPTTSCWSSAATRAAWEICRGSSPGSWCAGTPPPRS